MTEKAVPFNELADKVIQQLKDQKYSESTLLGYRRIYRKILVFLKDNDAEFYSPDLGEKFLNSLRVKKSRFDAYSCAIRRINACIEGQNYHFHQNGPRDAVEDIFTNVLDCYLTDCVVSHGNKPATVAAKKTAVILFLKQLVNNGSQDLSLLDTASVSKALLVYTNKDHYARIRQFLKYLADKGVTNRDFSGIVPHYKRRIPIPSVYSPAEIISIEESIDQSTITGIRNIAILRLATRLALRSGDIARLRWSEVDFKTGYISLIQEKTGQPLSLQMPDEVSSALKTHFENSIDDSYADGYVFHSVRAPYGRITTSIIRHVVTECFIKTGINTESRKHGPHAFRSSLASSMVNDGVSYETVRRILGHTDPNVILHYARTDVENLRRCALEPPGPTGCFKDYLLGKKVFCHV